MPRSTKYAGLICLILTLIAAAGIAVGIWKTIPLAVIAVLVPAVAYEAYRTEGLITRLASAGIFAVLLAEIAMILMHYELNIARLVPALGAFNISLDVKLAGPVLIAILSIMLLKRTAGFYTKWLSIIIFVGAIALFHSLDPSILGNIFHRGAQGGGGTAGQTIKQGVQKNVQQKIQQAVKVLKK